MTLRNSCLFFLCSLTLTTGASLFAKEHDILTEYRVNGIVNIEKKLDKKLTSMQYWQKYLQNKDTSFGFLESYENILSCDKSHSTLSVYKKDANGKFHLLKEYSAYTGKIKGDKKREGDLKTPVGVYDIVKKITKVDSFYGPMAFVTSYPNLYDRYQHKTGQGIWIHGLPIEQKRDEYTKGCIAINNDNIQCLDKNIDIQKTALIINENKLQKKTSKEELAFILSKIFAWRYAWIYNDLEAYLHFYDKEFRRFDGLNLQAFKAYKKRIFAKNEQKRIRFTDINLLPYPSTPNIYKLTFHEDYKSESFTFSGQKVLIVKLQNDVVTILTEQ
jgi:murein L,D-transpeptidase YafK